MNSFLITLEFIVAGLLIVAILLQPPKGDGFGAIGGQSRLFQTPTRELNSGLTRITIILGITFYGLAFFLGVLL